MSFAHRVVRISKGGAKKIVDISAGDQITDPAALAAQMVEIAPEYEDHLIGRPRASSLYGACMRLHVIGTVNKLCRTEKVSFGSKLTYGIGNAVGWWVQNDPTIFGERRVGWWKCRGCGKILYFGTPPKVKCKHCGALPQAIEYHEHYMNLKDVTGHQDLFLRIKKGLIRINETKTISGDKFPGLKAPKIEHVWQLLTYMWGSKYDENLPVEVDQELGYITYFSKKAHADMLPVKVFRVQNDEHTVRRMTAKLKDYRVGVDSYPSDLPEPDALCLRAEFSNYAAKVCPARTTCLEMLEK